MDGQMTIDDFLAYLSEGDTHITEEEIDAVLCQGSGFCRGKMRIMAFYAAEPQNKERAHFLKEEYGIGGGTALIGRDISMFKDYDAKGIRIRKKSDEKILTWDRVAKRIEKLILNDSYLSKKEKAEYIEYKSKNGTSAA